ncbi:hypothetical protein [Algihabitans sp.]|uniref:hypothetical protein n=1 Tax=Algihabitans sp. TaxID=2821514 RepID=UPI003BABA8C1
MTDEFESSGSVDRDSGARLQERSGRDPSKRQGDRRLRDIAVVLPIALLLTFLPPYVRIFDQNGLLGGVPLLLVYIFGIWSLVILASALLGRRLSQSEMENTTEGTQATAADEPTRSPGEAERGT